MQPRVLFSALLLALGLLVAVFLILGEELQDSNFSSPQLKPDSDPVSFELGPSEVVAENTAEVESVPPSRSVGRVITGEVFPLVGEPLPEDLVVRLLAISWPRRLMNKARVDATSIIVHGGNFGLQDRLPMSSDLKGILREITRIDCPKDGKFLFEGVAPGTYLICAGSQSTVWSPANQLVTLSRDSQQQEHCEVSLLPTRTLAVQVVSDGEAVPEAWVGLRGELIDRAKLPESLRMPVEKIWLFLLNDPFLSGMTSASGRVEFPVLPNLEYQIHARKSGVGNGSAFADLQEDFLQTVELESGGALSGVVSDAAGNPLANAKIFLTREVDINVDYFAPGAETVSLDDGSYLFADLKPGEYALRVDLDGYQSLEIDELILSREQELIEEIVLELGHRISGRVVDTQGNPLVGQKVSVRPDSVPEEMTDEEGRFEFTTLANRSYRVQVASACYLRSSIETEVDAEPLEIVVEPGLGVTGRFIDTEGNPVAAMDVQISDRARSRLSDSYSSTASDEEGRFNICSELVGDEESPLYLITFSYGYEKMVIPIEDGVTDLGDLVVTAASKLSGTVRAPDGSVVGGAVVEIRSLDRPEWDPTGRMRRTVISGAWGEYSISLPVSSRSWRVFANHSDYSASESIEIPAGEPGIEIPLDLTLTNGVNLEVWVTSAGEPVGDAVVKVSLSRGWNFVHKVDLTDNQGVTKFKGLNATAYDIEVKKTGFGSSKVTINLTDGQDLVQEVDLGSAISFGGFVLCDGVAVEGALVKVRDVSGTIRQTLTTSDGSFSVDNLASGALRVDVSAEGYMFRRVNGVDPREAPLTILLERSYELKGFVFDANTREPISRALVRFDAVDENGKEIPRSNRRIRSLRSREGFFTRDGLPAGNYRVRISSYEHFTIEQIIAVPTSLEVVDFPLERGEQIFIQVTNAEGEPIRRVRVTPMILQSGSGNRGKWTNLPTAGRLETNDKGELSIGALEEGPLRLRLRHRDYLEIESELEVGVASRSQVQRFSLVRGAVIRGRLLRPDGSPSSDKEIICESVGGQGQRIRTESPGSDGGFWSFRQLPEGEYRVRVKGSSDEPVSVMVQTGQSIEIQL